MNRYVLKKKKRKERKNNEVLAEEINLKSSSRIKNLQ